MTAEDRAASIPADFTQTLRGYVAELDGKIVGVMGVLHTSPPQAISRMEPELRKHPRTVIKAIALFKEMLMRNYVFVAALADVDEANSPAVLKRVGFKQVTEATATDKGVFLWHL